MLSHANLIPTIRKLFLFFVAAHAMKHTVLHHTNDMLAKNYKTLRGKFQSSPGTASKRGFLYKWEGSAHIRPTLVPLNQLTSTGNPINGIICALDYWLHLQKFNCSDGHKTAYCQDDSLPWKNKMPFGAMFFKERLVSYV